MLGWFYFHASVDLSSKGELHHPCPKMEYLSNQSTKMESGKVLQPFFGICIYEEPDLKFVATVATRGRVKSV